MFTYVHLADFIYKLGPAIKSNNITHWSMDECNLGVLEANLLFNTFRDMNSLKELHICEGEEGFNGLDGFLDDGIMTGCIQSLAACTGMRAMNLKNLNLSNNSCAALSAIFPRMAALLELNLRGNSINDDCARVLAQGLSECNHLRSLILEYNRIGDDGLDMLTQGLPTSVDTLDVSRNEVTLARQLLLLRFKKLDLWGNPLSLDGPRVIAASLTNPECRLECLNISATNIGDEGAATLAECLRSNQRLTRMYLANNNITENGWNAFPSVLCDTTSISATHGSNHTLRCLGYVSNIPKDVKMLLELNSGEDKSIVAANKILQAYHHLDMRPLFGWEFGLLPYVIAWLVRFAESRLDLKLSSMYEFVRAMPMKVTDGAGIETKGKKRKFKS